MSDRSRRDFGKYAIGMVGFSIVLAHLFFTMWTGGAFVFVRQFVNLTPLPNGLPGIKAVLLFLAGIYFGLLFLFSNDYYKRYQGLLLFIGSVVVIAALAIGGIGIVNMGPTPLNLGALGVGLLLGIGAGAYGGDLEYLDTERSSLGNAVSNRGEPLQFHDASRGLIGFIILLVFVANALNIMFVLPEVGVLQGVHLVGSVGFLWFLYQFIDLDYAGQDPKMTKSFEFLGPSQSGKTYLALGLYLAASQNDDYKHSHSSDHLQDLTEEHRQFAADHRMNSDVNTATAGDGGEDDTGEDQEQSPGWNLGNTTPDELSTLSFRVTSENTFPPKKAEIEIIDYAGEHLEDIASRVAATDIATDGGEENASDDEEAEEDSTDEESETGTDLDEQVDQWRSSSSGQYQSRSGSQSSSSNSSEDDDEDDSSEEVESDDSGYSFSESMSESPEESEVDDIEPEIDQVNHENATYEQADAEQTGDTDDSEPVDAQAEGISDNEAATTTSTDSASTEVGDLGAESGDPEQRPFVDDDEDAAEIIESEEEDTTTSDTDAPAETQSEATIETPPETDSSTSADPEPDSATGSATATTTAAEESTEDEEADLDPEQIKDRVATSVVEADKLVVIIDVERLLGYTPTEAEGQQGSGIKHLNRIIKNQMGLTGAQQSVQEVLLVATKADFLIPEWQNQSGYDGSPTNPRRWRDFADYIDERLSESFPDVGGLKNTANAYRIHPVMYKTEREETNGEVTYRPVLDDRGRLQPVGHSELLDALIE